MEQKETVCCEEMRRLPLSGCILQGAASQETENYRRSSEKIRKSRADHWNGRSLLLQKQSSCSFWP